MQFEKSADTKIIESVLREAAVGDVVTYEALSKAIGRDVRTHAYASLNTARQALQKEGVEFGTERKVGLVRLDDVKIVTSTEFDRKRIMRASKRTLRKLSNVKFDNLPEDIKRQHVATSAQIGAIAMFSSKASLQKIESKVVNSNSSVLPIGETLKLFSNGSN